MKGVQQWARLAALVLAAAAWLLLIALSSDALFVAGGSDAIVEIYTPRVELKVLASVCSLALLALAMSVRRFSRLWRGAFLCASGAILLIATHVVVVNFRTGYIEERWLSAGVRRAQIDVVDGVAKDWNTQRGWLGLQLTHKTSGQSVFLFCGVWPWNVDPTPSL